MNVMHSAGYVGMRNKVVAMSDTRPQNVHIYIYIYMLDRLN
jgi:hypothetical protein